MVGRDETERSTVRDGKWPVYERPSEQAAARVAEAERGRPAGEGADGDEACALVDPGRIEERRNGDPAPRCIDCPARRAIEGGAQVGLAELAECLQADVQRMRHRAAEPNVPRRKVDGRDLLAKERRRNRARTQRQPSRAGETSNAAVQPIDHVDEPDEGDARDGEARPGKERPTRTEPLSRCRVCCRTGPEQPPALRQPMDKGDGSDGEPGPGVEREDRPATTRELDPRESAT